MKTYGIVLIGCGHIGLAHLTDIYYRDNIRIIACVDTNLALAREAARRFGALAFGTDYRPFLERTDVDICIIATYTATHLPIMQDCFAHGKHVLCEKPAARTYADALEMQKAQHETGKVLNIGVVNRFNDSVNLIKQFIDEGKLGEVFHVYVSFRAHRSIPGLGGAFTTKAIAGGGALIDWGVHYLDIVMYCCGDPTPKTVTGEAFCKLGKDMKNYAYKNMWAENTKNLNGTYDVDDSVTALIRTAGPTITVNGAWAQNIGESETYIDFMGDKAGIRLQYGADFKVYTAEHGALIEYKPEFKQRNHFENEINAFIDCIKTGEKLPSHIDTVIVTAKMMQAIYDSSAEHKEITLAE